VTVMRIAVLCPGYGTVKRGAESVVSGVTKELRKRHEIKILGLGKMDGMVTINGTKRTSPSLEAYNKLINRFNLTSIPYVNTYDVESMTFSFNAFRYLVEKNEGFDAIWNNGGRMGDFFLAYYRKLTKTPFMTTIHGLPNRRLVPFNYGKLYGLSLPRPNHLVLIAKEYLPYYKFDKVSVINNGVDVDLFNPSNPHIDLAKYGRNIPLEHPVVLSTAALEPLKRPHLIIEAMKKLGKGTLIMTSDGSLRDEIVKMGNRELNNRFLYLGAVPFSELLGCYTLCDVFCLTSRNELFSVAVLEALASNKPVVTELDQTRRMVVGEAGILVKDATDTDSLSDAISSAYSTDYGSLPRRQAMHYSWGESAMMYERVFENICHVQK